MTQAFSIPGYPGRSFIRVHRNPTDIGSVCAGCVNDEVGAVIGCAALNNAAAAAGAPRCTDGTLWGTFSEVNPGPMTTGHPPEAETQEPVLLTEEPDHDLDNQFGTLPSGINLEPSPVGTSPAARPGHGGYPNVWNPTPDTVGASRITDPETSKAAAAAVGGGRLIELVLTVMRQGGNVPSKGWTGKELAEYTNRPLNSITPRFAQLRRKGLIHASGKRDKQIVWKIGSGVVV